MSDLRKLIEHIDHVERGGEFARLLDPATGRIVSVPINENLGKLLGAAAAGGALGYGASWLKDKFFSDKPNADSSGSSGSSNSTGSSGSSGTAYFVPDDQVNPEWKNYKQRMNPNGNQGHQGSGIDPNDDPNDPKTWPPGVKKAPDFGFLDPNGLWIPTPFDVRTGGRDSKWTIPQTSPANIIGIPASKLTPFQQKTQELGHKNCCTSASHLEQTKVVQLPNGAPQIPGYKQVDAKRFATDMKQSWGPNDFNWQYAYKNGNKFVLIVPWLWYNTKISIGRYYSGWNTNLRYDQNKVNTPNGVVYVAAKKWVVNDMFLDVIIHSTDNIGDKILANIKI